MSTWLSESAQKQALIGGLQHSRRRIACGILMNLTTAGLRHALRRGWVNNNLLLCDLLSVSLVAGFGVKVNTVHVDQDEPSSDQVFLQYKHLKIGARPQDSDPDNVSLFLVNSLQGLDDSLQGLDDSLQGLDEGPPNPDRSYFHKKILLYLLLVAAVRFGGQDRDALLEFRRRGRPGECFQWKYPDRPVVPAYHEGSSSVVPDKPVTVDQAVLAVKALGIATGALRPVIGPVDIYAMDDLHRLAVNPDQLTFMQSLIFPDDAGDRGSRNETEVGEYSLLKYRLGGPGHCHSSFERCDFKSE